MIKFSHFPKQISEAEARAAVIAVAEAGGNISAAARNLSVDRSKVSRRLARADVLGITAAGQIQTTRAAPISAAPRSSKTARYLFTAAQNNTKVNSCFWKNLRKLADFYAAEIVVARLRYNHSAGQTAGEKQNRSADTTLWYDAALDPYFRDERLTVAPGLIWAGDMNIIPTATAPLSGLDSFTGGDSCIFPHPQIALKSIAVAPGAAVKMNYTTGAVTLKNYIKRKAGLKAEFHHSYGALLVEVDSSATVFCRQINAGADGEIFDLDIRVAAGRLTRRHRPAVWTPGDLHGVKLDPAVAAAVWGRAGLVDTLRPQNQILHDVLDFGSVSHHNGFFDRLALHHTGADSVAGEISQTAKLINKTTRRWIKTFVVKSNHDEHLTRWLETADFRRDPANAQIYLSAAAAMCSAIERADPHFDIVEFTLRAAGLDRKIKFLSRTDRLEIVGIRHDQHGDLGSNGARGSAAAAARMGEKLNIGHSHSPAIVQGCYQAGTFSILQMGYNRGPSSWAQSGIITYKNGKRAVITLKNGRWRGGDI